MSTFRLLNYSNNTKKIKNVIHKRPITKKKKMMQTDLTAKHIPEDRIYQYYQLGYIRYPKLKSLVE